MVEYLNVKKEIGKDLYVLFPKDSQDEVIKRGFAAPEAICKDSILFVGMNPSFPDTKDNVGGNHFYPGIDNEKISSITKEDLKNENSYFRKMTELYQEIRKKADNNNLNFAHLDLLFCRETSQKQVLNYLKSKNGVSFIYDQLKLSHKLLEAARPKIIVIANAGAKEFTGIKRDFDKKGKPVGEWMNYTFKFDDKLGTHKIMGGIFEGVETKLTRTTIPVFFTSMISGQRALDKGSYERLVWHINFVLKQLPNGTI